MYIVIRKEKELQSENTSVAFSFCKSGNFTPGPSPPRCFCMKKKMH